jgi:hypothetical protein
MQRTQLSASIGAPQNPSVGTHHLLFSPPRPSRNVQSPRTKESGRCLTTTILGSHRAGRPIPSHSRKGRRTPGELPLLGSCLSLIRRISLCVLVERFTDGRIRVLLGTARRTLPTLGLRKLNHHIRRSIVDISRHTRQVPVLSHRALHHHSRLGPTGSNNPRWLLITGDGVYRPRHMGIPYHRFNSRTATTDIKLRQRKGIIPHHHRRRLQR